MAAKPTIREQAEKEIRRLEKAARRKAKKEGYEFDLPFRKTEKGTTKKRYTAKELEQLKRTKPKDLYKYGRKNESPSVSISATIIDNCMDRSKWRWSEKYYEKFADVVAKARAINENATAQAFQDMINDGTLIGIQKDYKPEDFWVDFSTFTDYFDDIVPDTSEELEEPEIEEDEDEADLEDDRIERMTAEEREEAARLFGGKW